MVGILREETSDHLDHDVVVVGGGLGGIYAVHRFVSDGWNVLGVEGSDGVGGVWRHNRYPGARVDVESEIYSYLFDAELVREWPWTERYATQPEILRYLEFVAEKYDVLRHFVFERWVVGATWDEELHCYHVELDDGRRVTARYVVMATGQLSKPTDPDFDGLSDYQGEWAVTGDWPDRPVELDGRRIAVIGTGSSGVQVIAEVGPLASQLTVFQRTPAWTVPSANRPFTEERRLKLADRADDMWDRLAAHPGAINVELPQGPAADYSAAEQAEILEERWSIGGATINFAFADQGKDLAANNVVAEFVRGKIRSIVRDPEVAEKLTPRDYPIGSRRVCVDPKYYETFNLPHVSIVDVREEPIVRLTERGIQTSKDEYEFDLIVFALGFDAFTGALNASNLRNAAGEKFGHDWNRGPRTFLGLMSRGFPNLFVATGPGSPSVLANMFMANVQNMNFIADLIAHGASCGATRIEPTADAQSEWSEHVQEVARDLLRRKARTFMVQIGDDGERYLIPYAGGFDQYVARCRAEVAEGFPGFVLSGADAATDEQRIDEGSGLCTSI